MQHALHLLHAVLLTSVAGSLAAQNCYQIPDNNSAAGTCNVIPFGDNSPTSTSWANQRYQTVVTAADLNNQKQLVTALGFAPCGTGTRQFATLQVQMAHIAGTMSTVFTANLGASPVMVLNVVDYQWQNVADTWNKLPLQRAFAYDPALGDLLVDITVTGVGMPVGITGMHRDVRPRMYAVGWVGTPPATGALGNAAAKIEVCSSFALTATFGAGCLGSNNQVPALAYSGSSKIGQILNIDLSSARPATAAFLLVGTTNAPPLPIDLSPIGMPGCKLLVDQVLVLTTPVNGSGVGTFPLVVPNSPALLGVSLFNQYFVLDAPANALGISASNGGQVTVGG